NAGSLREVGPPGGGSEATGEPSHAAPGRGRRPLVPGPGDSRAGRGDRKSASHPGGGVRPRSEIDAVADLRKPEVVEALRPLRSVGSPAGALIERDVHRVAAYSRERAQETPSGPRSRR